MSVKEDIIAYSQIREVEEAKEQGDLIAQLAKASGRGRR